MAEARAQTIIDEGIPSEETLRELLILCWHSSRVADSFFLSHANCTRFLVQLAQIAIDEKDYQGDAPPAAAYYLEKLPPPVLKGVADILLRGFPVEECGHNNSLAGADQIGWYPRIEDRGTQYLMAVRPVNNLGR